VHQTVRRRLLQAASFVLAGLLLALALYGVDLGRMMDAFREAEYWWLIPLTVLVLASNLCRAWRWNVLIEALPVTPNLKRDGGTAPRDENTLEASFSSVMIGYMVNYVAPRLGEVARTANMAARTPFRFSSLLGTVVAERIFDIAVLGLALLSTVVILFNRLGILERQFVDPAVQEMRHLPAEWVVTGGLAFLLLTGGTILLVRTLNKEDTPFAQFWNETVRPALTSFRDGLWTLLRSPRRGAILISTTGMWVGYLLMAYIPFLMLNLAGPYEIGLVDAWALMAIGALGILVPTPGGIGAYHYITQQALVHLYGVPAEPALTYAVLAHAAQFIFFVAAGGLAVLYQGTGTDVLFPSETTPQAHVTER